MKYSIGIYKTTYACIEVDVEADDDDAAISKAEDIADDNPLFGDDKVEYEYEIYTKGE